MAKLMRKNSGPSRPRAAALLRWRPRDVSCVYASIEAERQREPRNSGPSPSISPLRTSRRMKCDSAARPHLEPHIDARRVPVIRLVEDVHHTIAVQIRDPRLVETDAFGEDGFAE